MDKKWKWAAAGLGGLIVASITAFEPHLLDLGGFFKFENHGPTVLVGSQENKFNGPATDTSVAIGILDKQLAELAGKRDQAVKDLEAYQAAVQAAKAALEKLKKDQQEAQVVQDKRQVDLENAQATIADLRKQVATLTQQLQAAQREASSKVSQLQEEVVKWKKEYTKKKNALEDANFLLRKLAEVQIEGRESQKGTTKTGTSVPICTEFEVAAFPFSGPVNLICNGQMLPQSCEHMSQVNEGDGFTTVFCGGKAVASKVTRP